MLHGARIFIKPFPLECGHVSPVVGKWSIHGASGMSLWSDHQTKGGCMSICSINFLCVEQGFLYSYISYDGFLKRGLYMLYSCFFAISLKWWKLSGKQPSLQKKILIMRSVYTYDIQYLRNASQWEQGTKDEKPWYTSKSQILNKIKRSYLYKYPQTWIKSWNKKQKTLTERFSLHFFMANTRVSWALKFPSPIRPLLSSTLQRWLQIFIILQQTQNSTNLNEQFTSDTKHT